MACLLILGSTQVASGIPQAQIQPRDLEAPLTLIDAFLQAPP
ncbi:MAG: hypothetical protein PVJ07_09945 [Anaerolineales bacterium]|jgi:hypothetical protein